MLSPTQYGFRSNFSTDHAVLDIVNICNGNIEKKMYSGLMLLYLVEAFDMVDYQILLHKLEDYGIRGIVLQFYQSFLENRKQFVSINKFYFTLRDVNIGVPRGSTLGRWCSYYISMIFLTVLIVYLACLQMTPAYLSINLL